MIIEVTFFKYFQPNKTFPLLLRKSDITNNNKINTKLISVASLLDWYNIYRQNVGIYEIEKFGF